jgi:hypothetical protein
MSSVDGELGWVATGGERVAVRCRLGWVARMLREAVGPDLRPDVQARPSLHVRVESERQPFAVAGWRRVSRDAWRCGDNVILRNVITSGFDLLFHHGDPPSFTYRWNPPRRERLASVALRSRFHLIVRDALLHYPTLWRAGWRGRAPLHLSVCTAGSATVGLPGPGGLGKSTLVLAELAAGGTATSDNLCVSDGETAWGVVEPMRVEGPAGRRMPHGRRETVLSDREPAMVPDLLILLRRNREDHKPFRRIAGEAVERALVTGTFAAGELARFWAFAATLAAATEQGPASLPVERVAALLSARLPAYELSLPGRPGTRLSTVLQSMESLWT